MPDRSPADCIPDHATPWPVNSISCRHAVHITAAPSLLLPAWLQALFIAAQNEGTVRTDPLQRLHALHNLSELLGAAGASLPAGLAPTLRDSTLTRDAGCIRDEYMADSVARLAAAEKEFADSKAALEKVERQLKEGGAFMMRS